MGGTPVTVTPSANTLSALADAINSSGANVTATIVNLGSPSAPSYQLSLQSTKLGNISIQLNDGTNDLMGTLSAGSAAQYQVNGNPATPISSDSSTVTIAPGVTVDLLGSGDSTVTVSQSSAAQANALSSFVAAYNAAVDELSANRGQGGGALTGDALINTLVAIAPEYERVHGRLRVGSESDRLGPHVRSKRAISISTRPCSATQPRLIPTM